MHHFNVILVMMASTSALFHVPLAAQESDASEPAVNDEVADCSGSIFDEDIIVKCAKKRPADEVVVQRVQSNSSDAAWGTLPSRFNLEASQDGESASFSLGTASSRLGQFLDTDFSMKVTVPFNKGTNRGDFLTETGLPNSYSLEGSLSVKLNGGSLSASLPDLVVREVREVCRKQQDAPSASDAVKNLDCADDVRTIAPIIGMSQMVEQLFGRVEEEILRQQYVALQLSAGVGRQGFDHRDPITLAEIADNRTVLNAAASLVYLPSLKSKVGFIVGAEFERDYELPDEEIRCPTETSMAPSIICFSGSFGPPALEENATLFAGLRFVGDTKKLPIGGELRFAINPDNGEWGVEAPIYFLRNSDDQLNAGVRFGYDSERNDASISVFVGRNFGGLLGQ